ncbi:MAG: DUF2914 domain-containing protein [Proteobacteria bacterium]|nr:DUF2914 domain-containing protein [Pseudomonadota bacterium]
MMRPTRNRILSAALAGAGFVASSLAALPAMADGSIVVRNFVLSHGIHEREPISDTESFNIEDGQAYAFARIQNTGEPTNVSFVWEYGDKTHASVPVTVGASPGWRTWSTAKLRSGNWRVKLVDAQGDVLLVKAFTVGSNSGAPVAMPAEGVQSEMGDPVENAISDDLPASVTFPLR